MNEFILRTTARTPSIGKVSVDASYLAKVLPSWAACPPALPPGVATPCRTLSLSKHSVNFHAFLSFSSRDFLWPGMFLVLSFLLKLQIQCSQPLCVHPPLQDLSPRSPSLLSHFGSASFSSPFILCHPEGVLYTFVHVN